MPNLTGSFCGFYRKANTAGRTMVDCLDTMRQMCFICTYGQVLLATLCFAAPDELRAEDLPELVRTHHQISLFHFEFQRQVILMQLLSES